MAAKCDRYTLVLPGAYSDCIFTARRYASAVLVDVVCPSVCPSVRLSVRYAVSNLNCIVKDEGLLKVTGSHMHWNSGNILETALDTDV